MATFEQDLRTLLTNTTAITSQTSTRVHYNTVPQFSTRPQVWFQTRSDNEELCLDGTGGLHEAFVDLECIADTETAAQNTGAGVKTLHGYRGSVGSHTAKGIFVDDKDDDYIPKTIISEDDGRHVVAYELRCFYTT